MSQSAEDALRLLKAKIELNIEKAKISKYHYFDKNDYAAGNELNIRINEQEDIVRIIDEMINGFNQEGKHTHKWQRKLDLNFSCYYCYCDCGATLTAKQIEEYVNEWQKQLDSKVSHVD